MFKPMRFKPVLWTKKRNDGARHIKIYISKARKVFYHSLNIFTYAEKINPEYMQWIDGRVANSIQLNLKIKEALDRFNYLYLNNTNITIDEIVSLYEKKDFISFYDWYASEVELRKKKVSLNTGKFINKLTYSLRLYSPELRFDQIDYEFISRFEGFLKDMDLKQTTIYRRLKCFKMFLAEAVRQEKIKSNPFEKMKLRDGVASRQFLDKDTLEKIRNAKKLTTYEIEARTKFLFQCYTGLAYSDLVELKWSEIRDNAIYRERIKTKESLVIPLMPQAKEILDKKKRVGETVFSKISNQKYNVFLHAIEARAEISVPLTSHIARHTFATLALDAGVSMAVVSSILGHTNIRTTQIYGKITKKLKEEEMRKLRF